MSESNSNERTSSSVLVVDDNEANEALAPHALEDEGYRVILAEGLGLAFCKLAVEAHRGTIVVEDVNRRASFFVRLPDVQ